MTAPEPARLSEDECGRIVRASIDQARVLNGPVPRDGYPADVLLTTVADILTARRAADAATIADLRDRLAAVEALADHWQRVGVPDSPSAYGMRLRRVLAGEGGEG